MSGPEEVGGKSSDGGSLADDPRMIIADSGQVIVLRDVVDGRWPELVEPMQAMLAAEFPEHLYAADQIAVDAVLPSHRDGIVVHQWFLTIDNRPAGVLLQDSNIVRGVAPIHFVTVEPDLRDITVDGERLGQWWCTEAVRQLEIDGNGVVLGAVGETPEYKLKAFLRSGWRVLPVDYAEPVEGWQWPERGMDMRAIPLIWLPPHGADADLMERDVAAAGAAAFLLDMYHLPADHPKVAPLVGSQAAIRGPQR
jgi:hypothetical protein